MLRPTTTITADNRDMTLGSGKPIWYKEPSKTQLELEDFRIPLFNIRRYNGAIDWQLGRHLALGVLMIYNDVARFGTDKDASINVAGYFAAHDLHEVIVGDVVSGMKKYLPEYNHIELAWEQHVHEQIGLDFLKRPSKLVRHYDLRALIVEMHQLEHPAYDIAVTNVGTGPATLLEQDVFQHVQSLTDNECWDIILQAILLQQGK